MQVWNVFSFILFLIWIFLFYWFVKKWEQSVLMTNRWQQKVLRHFVSEKSKLKLSSEKDKNKNWSWVKKTCKSSSEPLIQTSSKFGCFQRKQKPLKGFLWEAARMLRISDPSRVQIQVRFRESACWEGNTTLPAHLRNQEPTGLFYLDH